MAKNNETIEGLVVLEYLNLGIMPFYPGKPGKVTADKKAKRKFRKIWRKIASNKDVLDRYIIVEGKNYPSKSKLWRRKMLVHTWLSDRVKAKYGMGVQF